MTRDRKTRHQAAPTGQLLDTRTVAWMLGVHVNTVTNMTTRGELRPVRIGPKLVRYRRADIEALIEAGTRPSPTAA